MKYAALLRGINVGGRQIKMAELKTCIEQAGFMNVKTLLQSGNVVLESDLPAGVVRKKLEQTVGETFGYEAVIFVYPLQAIADIVAASPFNKPEKDWHSYIVFVDGDDALNTMQGLINNVDTTAEEAKLGDGVVYWTVPVGGTLTSAFAKQMAKGKLKFSLTNRNKRTLQKMAALL